MKRFQNLEKLAKIITEQIKSTTGKIHVIGQYDCDGIASSGIMCHALDRENKKYNLSLLPNLSLSVIDDLNENQPDLVIFTDLGSGQKRLLSNLKSPGIIIDHHISNNQILDNIIEYNPTMYNLNGSYDACSSSLAYSIARLMDGKNMDLAPLAMAGIIGDRQHFGGIRGLNKKLIDEAIQSGNIKVDNIPSLFGKNIGHAIYNSLDPYIVGFSGKIENVNRHLIKMNIDPKTPLDKLDEESLIYLSKWINNQLIKQNKYNGEFIENNTKRFWLNDWTMDASELHWLLDSSGRNLDKETSIGVVNKVEKSLKLAKNYSSIIRGKILNILNNINSNIIENNYIQYFHCADPNLKGLACGFAMDWFLNPSKPVFGFALHRGQIVFSARGTYSLVRSGLNLSNAVRTVTKELGGSGGGHAIAAGGRMPKDQLNFFLVRIDATINKQLVNDK